MAQAVLGQTTFARTSIDFAPMNSPAKSPIDVAESPSPILEPANSPTVTPPRKKAKGDELEIGDMLGNALAAPSDAGTHHLIQMTHALVQRVEHNIGQKLDMIQAQQKTLTETVDQHTAQLASNSEDIASINARVQTLENDPKTSPHIEKLEIEMNNLAQQMQEFSHQRVSFAPPSSRASLPPRDSSRASTLSPTRPRATVPAAHAASVDLEVDWNRLIIGGRREKIESEAKQLLQAFGIQESVNELIVYGRRACVPCPASPHAGAWRQTSRPHLAGTTQRQAPHSQLQHSSLDDPPQKCPQTFEESSHQVCSQPSPIHLAPDQPWPAWHWLEQTDHLVLRHAGCCLPQVGFAAGPWPG